MTTWGAFFHVSKAAWTHFFMYPRVHVGGDYFDVSKDTWVNFWTYPRIHGLIFHVSKGTWVLF